MPYANIAMHCPGGALVGTTCCPGKLQASWGGCQVLPGGHARTSRGVLRFGQFAETEYRCAQLLLAHVYILSADDNCLNGLKTVQIVRQGGQEPPDIREYSTQPDAMVRLLAAEVTSASELPAGVKGIAADGGGVICEPPSRLQRFADLDTAPALVATEALRLSCTYFKSSLISHLNALGAKGVLVLEFLDEVVAIWLHLQRRRHAARSPLREGDEVDEGTSASSSGHNSQDGANSGGSKWPALNRESFDVVVAAFTVFRDQPALFGADWSAGSPPHINAVGGMADALRSAFEAEIDGPWQQQQQQRSDDEWPVPTHMPESMFEALLSECSIALSLRQLRNESVAHPFDHPDLEIRQQLFELFKEEVTEGGRMVSKMRLLAEVAIGHVGSMLARVKDKELESDMVEPGSMCVRDIYRL